MDDKEIRKTIKRLTNLSNEAWKLEWGESETSFLIDLIDSEISDLEEERDIEKSHIEDMIGLIEEIEKDLKEARRRENEITKKQNQKKKLLLQLKNLLESHINIY